MWDLKIGSQCRKRFFLLCRQKPSCNFQRIQSVSLKSKALWLFIDKCLFQKGIIRYNAVSQKHMLSQKRQQLLCNVRKDRRMLQHFIRNPRDLRRLRQKLSARTDKC